MSPRISLGKGFEQLLQTKLRLSDKEEQVGEPRLPTSGPFKTFNRARLWTAL